MKIARSVAAIPPSGIRRFFDVVSQMDDVISLGVGEPDFGTAWRVREAAIYGLERGRTSYTANSGLLELRQAIAAHLRHRYDLAYDPGAELLITVGVSAVGAAAILTARFRRGIAGDVSRDGLDSALRAIAMYRIIRTLAAYFLAEAGAVLLTNPEAWGTLIPWSDNIAPGPSMLIGALLAATAVVTAVTPVRSLLGRIPRNNDDKQSQPTL